MAIEFREVDALPHGGGEGFGGFEPESPRLNLPAGDRLRQRPGLGFQHVLEGADQQRSDR